MKPGRYLINNFTAADGYQVTAPDEIRVAEITASAVFVRVIWDVRGRDQSWEKREAVEKAVVEYLDEPGLVSDPGYPSLTTADPVQIPGMPPRPVNPYVIPYNQLGRP